MMNTSSICQNSNYLPELTKLQGEGKRTKGLFLEQWVATLVFERRKYNQRKIVLNMRENTI